MTGKRKTARPEFDKELTKLIEAHKAEHCDCAICRMGEEKYRQWEQECLEKTGWLAHSVVDDVKTPLGVNFHTHGIKENFNHTDFQIVLPLRPEIAHSFFNLLVEEIKNGKTFEAGKEYDNLTIGYITRFINAKECGRDVLRMLICNPEGTYEGEMYEAQFTMLDNKE